MIAIPKRDPKEKEEVPQIKMHPVVSSNISSAGYDPATETLAIRFSNGALYQYTGVTKEIYEAMWGAESIGRSVHENIAKKFKFKQIKTPKI